MLYSGNEAHAPDIESEYPRVNASSGEGESDGGNTMVSKVMTDPKNKTWITSTLALKSNMMNALSVAIRSYIDNAVSHLDVVSNESGNSCSDDKGKLKLCMEYLDTTQDVLNGKCLSFSISLPNASYHMLVKALHVAVLSLIHI